VSPLYKSGTTVSVNNYYPISLTSIPCKISEHIALRNLLEKSDTKLNNRQHGFRRGLSCETQICATMHDILYAIDNQKTVHAAVLDFTKAFDWVPHGLLLQKLSQTADVDNYLLRWVHNFLTDRKQRVVLQGCSSDPKPVRSGVPQEPVLGPVLFYFLQIIFLSVLTAIVLFLSMIHLFTKIFPHLKTVRNFSATWTLLVLGRISGECHLTSPRAR